MPHKNLEKRKLYMAAYNAQRQEERRKRYQRDYAERRDLILERARIYYGKNKEKCQLAAKQYRIKNAARLRLVAQKRAIENPERVMFNSAKIRAKKNNIPFALAIEDIKIPKFCPVFGVPFTRGIKYNCPNSPTLDRKNPDKGYVKNNVFVVSWRANRLKGDAKLAELKSIVRYMEQK